ncbi:DMT family transporter [Streptomyces sp. HMX87]|uniref:DMT family transporter n=1 Tax=Streptomyces sp. HMX87 TaxID=3390849 RepID=UPI003A887E9F
MPSRTAGRYGGQLFALLATAIWAGNLIAARGLRDDVPPVSLAFWRCVLAVVVILPWTARPFRNELRSVGRHVRLLSLLGLSGIAVFTVLVYVAAHTTTATNLSLLDIAASVFIVLFAWAAGQERLDGMGLIGSALAVAGVVVLVTEGALTRFDPNPGDLWMLGAAVIFALYCLLVRRVPVTLSEPTVLLATFGSALIFLLPAYLVELSLVGGFAVTPGLLGSLVYVGVMSSAVAYFCWNRAVKRIGASKAGVVYYLLPLITALLGIWVLGEPVSWHQVLSMVLIVLGVALGLRGPRRPPRRLGHRFSKKEEEEAIIR